jgi:hypothetical protein
MKAAWTTLATLALAALVTTAQAGRPCEQRQPEAGNVLRAMELAARTQARLVESGATVVVLARAGQDLGAYGLNWSHLGYAYREGDGRWRVVHKLNQCGSATAAVYRQGLGEFFLDDLFDYRAGIAVPSADVQAHLLPLLRDNRSLAQLNQPAYSMLAYPWAQRYQQSNQWAIETLALAQEPGATSRERAQAWLQFKGYVPTTLHIGALTRLGARLSAANIAFDDHPDAQRFSGRIETVTVDSVFDWLGRSGMAGPVQVVR